MAFNKILSQIRLLSTVLGLTVFSVSLAVSPKPTPEPASRKGQQKRKNVI